MTQDIRRIQLAVHAYRTQAISLGKAASMAGGSWARMKDILVEHGVQPRLGPETLEEAQEEVEVLREFMAKREAVKTRLNKFNKEIEDGK